MKNSGKKYITINRKIAGINAYYAFLYKKGENDELLKVKPFKIQMGRQFKGLKDDDLVKLKGAIYDKNNLMHICIFELLLNTGIRVSELIAIKKEHFVEVDGMDILIIFGKGEKVREVPLNEHVIEAVREYVAIRDETDSDNLIIGQRGAVNRNAINSILNKYGLVAGVKVKRDIVRMRIF